VLKKMKNYEGMMLRQFVFYVINKFHKKMHFSCKSKESISSLTERVILEAKNGIELTVDIHTGHLNLHSGDTVDFKFDDSLEYACNATTVARNDSALQASCGGLLFIWMGAVPIAMDEFTFSMEKSAQPPPEKANVRRSKRTRPDVMH
jgi:hypothetical protein